MRLLAKLERISLLVPLALQGCAEKGHVRISEKEFPWTAVLVLQRHEANINRKVLIANDFSMLLGCGRLRHILAKKSCPRIGIQRNLRPTAQQIRHPRRVLRDELKCVRASRIRPLTRF